MGVGTTGSASDTSDNSNDRTANDNAVWQNLDAKNININIKY